MKHHRMHRRLMAAFATFTLGVATVFGLFAMAFVYTVEDRFLERTLKAEVLRQRAYFAQHGRWAEITEPGLMLHASRATLPPDLAAALNAVPDRQEAAGTEGRHYHLLPLAQRGEPPWLVTEVSRQLIVRPMRERLLGWLVGWGLAMVALALGLAWWLARRTSAPLERLARDVAQASPEHLPAQLAQGAPNDEVGAVARAFDVLLARTRAFIEREQAFTRDVSHELRTPLAVLRMGIDGLQRDAAASSPTRLAQPTQEQLGMLKAAVEQLTYTVDSLMVLAREDAADLPAEVAILPLVEHWALAHADWIDGHGLQLDVALSSKNTLSLPEPVLRLVLANLLGNAFRHGVSPSGQSGTVRVHLRDGRLCVCNPGAALPQDAGEAYVKGDASDGLGLGLSIVRRLLAQHGAVLEAEHTEGVTCLCVRVGAGAR
jgi:signal transduction histidine kinase